MSETIKERDILFLDIETVPAERNYAQLNDRFKKLWDKKAAKLAKENESPEALYARAGIYAEFGRIICICSGEFEGDSFIIRSFSGDDEAELLKKFAHHLNTKFNKDYHRLCAHNGIEFDFPYIARRMLVHQITLPKILEMRGKKPWEVQHIDTMHLWRFGDFKAYTSLDLLTALFDIPTPKDDIDGSMVYATYYEENGLSRIVKYCRKDTLSVAQLLRKYYCKPLIRDEEISIIEG